MFLAAYLAYHALVAWHVRHNHAAERLLTWAELRESSAAISSLRIIVGIVVWATIIGVGLVAAARMINDIDVERWWLGKIDGAVLAVIGVYFAYRCVEIVRLRLARRRAMLMK